MFTQYVRSVQHVMSLTRVILVGLALATSGGAAEAAQSESWDTYPSPSDLVQMPDDGGKYVVLTFDLLGRNWAAFKLGERALDQRGNILVRLIVYHADTDDIPIGRFKYSRTLPSNIYTLVEHVNCVTHTIVAEDRLNLTDSWYGGGEMSSSRNIKPSAHSRGNTYVSFACDPQLRDEMSLRLHLSREDAVTAMMDLELDADIKEEAAALARASQ